MGKALKFTVALAVGMVSALLLLGACGSDPGERFVPAESLRRDITLQSGPAAPVEVASAVELGRPEPKQRTAPRRRPSPRPALVSTPKHPAPLAAPTAELVAMPVKVAAVETEVPAPAPSGRELAPGQTVTVLPASTGQASAGPDDVYLPTEPGRGMFKPGGGDCPHPPRRGRPIIGLGGFR